MSQYDFLHKLKNPRMLVEGVYLLGTYEGLGDADNPIIINWSKECGIQGYTHDAIPWCGLFMAVCAKRAGWDIPKNPLWALNWTNFGRQVGIPMLGDVMVFKRKLKGGGTAGHVAMYVGEDKTHWHILGGNQGDRVSIVRRPKNGWFAVRRPKWKVSQPVEVRKIELSPTDNLAGSEA
jgi:uncharacterized protein (TIGR02594 family)